MGTFKDLIGTTCYRIHLSPKDIAVVHFEMPGVSSPQIETTFMQARVDRDLAAKSGTML